MVTNLKPRIVGGKNLHSVRQKITTGTDYKLSDALDFLISNSYTKFDQTLDIVVKLGVDPKQSDQVVRGVTVLPAGTGKLTRIAVVCKDDKISLAKNAGADIVGSSDIIDAIKAGKIDFDVCITSPDMVPALAQVAKILGPKGLMPSAKTGTVTNDLEGAIARAKAGQVNFRIDKAAIVHAGIGKLSFGVDKLTENVKALMNEVVKAKPQGSKGAYIKDVYVSSTMGPALRVVLSDLSL